MSSGILSMDSPSSLMNLVTGCSHRQGM
jgi:hypothetical protein